MIYFKETFTEDGDVFIRIEGELNNAAMPVLRDLCAGHLGKKRKLSLNLEDVNRIDTEGLAYLKSIPVWKTGFASCLAPGHIDEA